MDETIIIIGAGAAGLMAARELSLQGKKVAVLEAAGRTGGRIHTLCDGFEKPVELGAEFVHGKLPLTLNLLNEAGIRFHHGGGKMVRVNKGKWITGYDYNDGWEELEDKMMQLQQDMTVTDFLDRYFKDERYKELRQSVHGFADGFDLADITNASTIALRNEWMLEEHGQYRVEGGYQKMTDYLVKQCRANGCEIITSCVVKEIHRDINEVKIICADGSLFSCNKAILTVALSVLQHEKISFFPAVENYLNAAKKMGYGMVIKILLEFEHAFWNDCAKNTGFILSDEAVPTWWTQAPDNYPLLTAWLGSAKAKMMLHLDDENILQLSLQSLSNIFSMKPDELKQKLTAWKVMNWGADEFAIGGYSYDTLYSAASRKILNVPVEQTIYFAGEAMYEGASPGTVEAALVSGKEVARKILVNHI